MDSVSSFYAALDRSGTFVPGAAADPLNGVSLQHLDELEAESIHIMREAVAESANPVMLYSIGKDSSVLLHLALKAFYPSKPPFALLHVDTTWKFRDMIAFRDARVRDVGCELIVHVNRDGLARGINPVTGGPSCTPTL
jgi:sulfate adenylyltransferase subunit 2